MGTKFTAVDDGTAYGKVLADSTAKVLQGKKTIALHQSFASLADKPKAICIEVVVSTLNDFQVITLIEALKKIDYTNSITIRDTTMLKFATEVKALIQKKSAS